MCFPDAIPCVISINLIFCSSFKPAASISSKIPETIFLLSSPLTEATPLCTMFSAVVCIMLDLPLSLMNIDNAIDGSKLLKPPTAA